MMLVIKGISKDLPVEPGDLTPISDDWYETTEHLS